MSFDFPPQKGCGLSRLIPHCSPSSLALLHRMLQYDPEDRIGAGATLQHPCFRELRRVCPPPAVEATPMKYPLNTGTAHWQAWRL